MDQKVRGVIAYVFGWIGGLIILLGFKADNDSRTKFNACQAIVISVIGWVVSLVANFIPYVGGFASGIASILLLVCSIIGIVKSVREEDCEFPLISDLTRSIFKKQLD